MSTAKITVMTVLAAAALSVGLIGPAMAQGATDAPAASEEALETPDGTTEEEAPGDTTARPECDEEALAEETTEA